MKMQNQEIIAEKQQTVAAIQDWLVSYLSQLLAIDKNEVEVTTSFDRYGLDSSATIGLTTDLGDYLGRSIDPTITYDYPSIESLSEHLAGS
jgi:acyl carrier protein